jgi:hypothetical protein
MMAKTPVLAPKITTWINVEILDEPVIPSNDVPVVEVAEVTDSE